MIFKKIGNMENVEVICHYLPSSRVYTDSQMEGRKSMSVGLKQDDAYE